MKLHHMLGRVSAIVVFSVVVAAWVGPVAADEERVRPRDSAIRLIDGLDPGLAAARDSGRPVFLLFSAVWCPVCQELKRRTLLDRELQELAEDFVWVEVDIDRNTIGFAYFGSDSFLGLDLADDQITALLALEWRFAPRMSLLLQYLGSESVIDDFGPFSERTNEITLGWKGEIRPAGVLEFGLIENVVTFDNSPDFGFHLGYTQRF